MSQPLASSPSYGLESIDQQALQADAAAVRDRTARQYDRKLSFYKFVPGANLLRILPPWSQQGWDQGYILLRIGEHRFLQPWLAQPEDKSKVRCVEYSFPERGLTCPVCEAERKLAQFGHTLKSEFWPRHYANVIDMRPVQPGYPPQRVYIGGFSSKIGQWLRVQFAQDHAGVGVLHPLSGTNLKVQYNSKGEYKDRYRPSWDDTPSAITQDPQSPP